jgi:hypothetical protein
VGWIRIICKLGIQAGSQAARPKSGYEFHESTPLPSSPDKALADCPNSVDGLRGLEQLKNDGLISDQEYKTKRNDILEEL